MAVSDPGQTRKTYTKDPLPDGSAVYFDQSYLLAGPRSLSSDSMVWPFIFISYASLFVFGLCDNVRGPLFPEILKYFAVSDSMGSWMFAMSAFSGFVSSYFSRTLLLRFDRKTVLQAGALGLIAAILGLATAPHFYVFLFFSFFFGLCQGILGLIPNILVPIGSSPEKKQQLLSGLHTMYGVASLCSPLLAAFVQHMTGSWRWTFVFAGAAPLALFIYSLHKSHDGFYTKAAPRTDSAVKRMNHHFKPQIFLALMVSFSVAAEIMVSSRIALYMRREMNFDMEASSLYTTYFFIAMMLGRLLFAVVPFKRSPRVYLSGALSLSGVFLFAGLYGHPLFLAFVGFSIAPFYPLAISWISTEYPNDLDTAVSYMIATDSVMLIFMHLFIGTLTDFIGIHSAILIGSIFLILSLFMVNSFAFFFRRKQAVVKVEQPA